MRSDSAVQVEVGSVVDDGYGFLSDGGSRKPVSREALHDEVGSVVDDGYAPLSDDDCRKPISEEPLQNTPESFCSEEASQLPIDPLAEKCSTRGRSFEDAQEAAALPNAMEPDPLKQILQDMQACV